MPHSPTTGDHSSSPSREEPTSPTEANTTNELVRLHVTPLTADLLPRILNTSIAPLATNVSFHHVQTFPEKSYGFVTLPRLEAEKLKKKLHGSILKGAKISIEMAKSEKRKSKREAEAAAAEEIETPVERPSKRSKKEKPSENVTQGVELPEGRKVKRGWTDENGGEKERRKSRRDKSQVEDSGEKVLFRTEVPPNKKDLAAEEDSSSKKKKDKKDKKDKKSSKRDAETVTVVKEGKRSKQLPDGEVSKAKTNATEFVEGKGWVDANGAVVEDAPKSSRPKKEKKPKRSKEATEKDEEDVAPPPPQNDIEDPTPRRRSKRDIHKTSTSTETAINPATASKEPSPLPKPATTATAIARPGILKKQKPSTTSNSTLPLRDDNTGTSTPTAQTTELPAAAEIHPLEALYKRSPNKPPPIDTTFSFFDAETAAGVEGEAGNGGDGDAAGEGGTDEGVAINDPNPDGSMPKPANRPRNLSIKEPMTPFTTEDRRQRGVRSAAPTPDTAVFARRGSFPFLPSTADIEEDEDEDDDSAAPAVPASDGIRTKVDERGSVDRSSIPSRPSVDPDRDTPLSDVVDGKGTGEKEESEFAKYFWEHRGELNRSWKERRRVEKKEERRRENRKRARAMGLAVERQE